MIKSKIHRVISFVLAVVMLISTTACSSETPNAGLSDPNSQIITENIEGENIEVETVLDENVLTEFITSEIYLEELVVAEDKISELLLEEETISEVLMCKTIYVPQDNIDEFAENSQTAGLFGEEVKLAPVLKRVAVGTGVIVTLVILKRSGLPDPIASAVVAAADESLKFASTGAALGGLFGGVTGATDEIDQSGRTSAVIGFATATAGLIISIVSLVAAAPSAGSSTITLAAGIKLVIAGIGVAAAAVGEGYAGYNAIKTFTSTDGVDIDWDNIDWEKAGVSATQQAINYGSEGYMWGAIIGAVHGGAEGYDFYQKYNTPYSKYNARLVQTPVDDEYGHWTGTRGESEYIYDQNTTIKVGNTTYEIKAGTKVTYKNAVPDFSPFQKAQVNITGMSDSRYSNFKKADEALAKYWSEIKYDGKTWTTADVTAYRESNGLTWHEMNNMQSMQLVPTEINAGFGHLGGVGEYNAMIGAEGVTDYD